MHANIESLPDDTAPIKKAHERLISIPYMLLRASTAGGAVVTGFVQTFVFARVLAPERFSIFIVFYAALAIAASCLCFAAALAQLSSTLRGAFELALFLLYITLNLAWTSLRSI